MTNIDKLREKYKAIEGERFFRELFENHEYEPVLSMKAEVVVDIGALAGEFCAYIYEKAGSIYALEPYSKHYQELTANVAEFNLTKIKPFQLALSNQAGQARLCLGTRGGHTLGDGESGEYEEVPTQTLAQFMEKNDIKKIDILKIDIEGGENAVFSSPDFAMAAPHIAVIIGEHLDGSCHEILTKLGYKNESYQNNTIYSR